MTDHVGIMNIGMDGMMLTTAFFAVLGSVFLGGWLGGLALAMAVGLLMGAFFGLFVVKFKSDEYIIGVALNIFAGGLTVFLLRTIFGVAGAFSGNDQMPIQPLPKIRIPLIENIPILGDLLSGNTLLVYVSWILVARRGRASRVAARRGQEPGEDEIPRVAPVRVVFGACRRAPVAWVPYNVYRKHVRVARIHCGRVRDFWNVESTESVFGGATVRLYRCARFACAIVQRVLKPDLARAISGYGGDDGLRGLARRTEKKTFGKAGKIVNLNRLPFV